MSEKGREEEVNITKNRENTRKDFKICAFYIDFKKFLNMKEC